MIQSRRSFLSTGAVLAATACATEPIGPWPKESVAPRMPVVPLQISADNLDHMTVCTRPFRPAGPRIEAEAFGDKTVIHNYGHGGSGWSLSWACAEEATTLARQTGARTFAVIGAGVIGLTTAVKLAESGAMVSIYAKDLPSESRSARATGVWSPSSRIALHDAAPADFADRWEGWARTSFAAHERYIGAVGRPVETQPFYALRGDRRTHVPATHEFMHLDRRLSDLRLDSRTLLVNEHPFPVSSARLNQEMVFNIAVYTERILRDFFKLGGRMQRRVFADQAEALSLPESVIVNCTGYGAKALWGADELVPVRGQINWMPPQLEARYGLYYDKVYVLSRSDGVVVQYTGPNDDYGYGIEDETPDRVEMQRAMDRVAPLFAGWA